MASSSLQPKSSAGVLPVYVLEFYASREKGCRIQPDRATHIEKVLPNSQGLEPHTKLTLAPFDSRDETMCLQEVVVQHIQFIRHAPAVVRVVIAIGAPIRSAPFGILERPLGVTHVRLIERVIGCSCTVPDLVADFTRQHVVPIPTDDSEPNG